MFQIISLTLFSKKVSVNTSVGILFVLFTTNFGQNVSQYVFFNFHGVLGKKFGYFGLFFSGMLVYITAANTRLVNIASHEPGSDGVLQHAFSVNSSLAVTLNGRVKLNSGYRA